MILKILVKKPNVDGDTFIHFWNNNSDNFWDTCKSQIIEVDGHKVHKETEWYDMDYKSPMDFYLDEFYPNYEWKEIEATKIQRSNLDSMEIQMSIEEVEEYKNFFFKIIDGNTEMYYYCESISNVSDQNNIRSSYVLNCELDLWATYWALMHSYMKKFDVELSFANKMCDRFVFDNYVEGTFTRGFWIDYIQQQWLCRTNQYTSDLYNIDNQTLTLDNWLSLNSSDSDWATKWAEWNKTKPVSYIDCITPDQTVVSGYTLDGKNKDKIQNVSLCNVSQFTDDTYNSNNKYRYFVMRLGNNYLPVPGDANKHKVGINTQSVEEKYFNGTGEVSKKTYINGETICILPFPRGSEENKYIYQLNSTDKGLTIGNGTVMGMPINDIPPSILALGLRNYNDTSTITQTIGDRLCFRDLAKGSDKFNCPIDLTSLRLSTLWDWPQTKFIFDDISKNTSTKGYNGNWLCWGVDEDHSIHVGDTVECAVLFSKIKPNEYYSMYIDDDKGQFPVMREKEGEWKQGSSKVLWLFYNLPGFPSDWASSRKQEYYFHYKGKTSNEADVKNINNWEYVTRHNDCKGITIKPTEEELKTLKIGDWCYNKDKGTEYAEILYHYVPETSYDYLPCMFTDFSYIPVVISKRKDNEVKGWNNFFENTYKLMVEGGIDTTKNTIEAEPLFYGPGIYKWTYYIDGIHKIELTNDMIDIKKFMEEDWEVKLNVVMSTHTSYLLDFKDIRNKEYPMTKVGMEFISEEYTSYPFTTEAYNNWLQTNQSYIETAKNAKDIDYKWKMKNATLGGLLGIGERGLSGAASGAMSGAMIGAITGGGPGAIGGGILGGLAGAGLAGVGIFGRKMWIKRAYQETMEQFNNQVQGMKNNLFSSPATMVNPSGFNAGSVIYSPTAKIVKKEYELFKLYTIPEIVKSDIWKDISWNGYQFASQCLYGDYNNRVNFNIVNCNMYSKSYMAINYLRENMMETLPFFSQEDNIVSFFNRCSNIMRLFKCKYSEKDMNKIIEGNIELKREWVLPYQAKVKFIK